GGRGQTPPMVTSAQPMPPSAPRSTHYLASSPDPGQAAAAAIFGAPLDLTESFRGGAHGGPAAVRYMSDGLESYSPVLDRDLEDVLIRDLGNLELEGASMPESLDRISAAMRLAAGQARLGVMVGGEHTA